MEPLPGISAYAAVFDRATCARLEAAERFVLSLPALFPDALVGCDLGWRARTTVLAVVMRFSERRLGPGGRARLDFWCARASVRATPLAPLPPAQRSAFFANFARCQPRLEGIAPDRLLADTEDLFTQAGAPAGRARSTPAAPLLLIDAGGPGKEGLRFVPGERTLFVPGVLAPPEGDEVLVALRVPGIDRPLRSRAKVVGVRSPALARAGGTAGYALAFLDPPEELCSGLARAVAGPSPSSWPGEEHRVHPRFRVKTPVLVTPRTAAEPPPDEAVEVPLDEGPDEAPAAAPGRALIEYASDQELAADYVDNLSQGGALVRTSNPSPPGTRLTLAMRLPGGEELSAPAVVACVNAKGMGVKFELSEEGEQRLAAAIARISARPRRALVVDDERLVRAMLQEALRERGFEVLTAEDGAAGLTVLADELLALDLLVTDVNMPRMDGESLIRTIRSAGGESDLAIVVVAASLEGGLERRLEREGADAVLDKALGPELIAQAADAVLERKRQR